jgi:hypothetical protein
MRAQEFTESRSAASRVAGLLTWLGGGHWRELGERYERSTHAVAGAVVVCGAVLAWLVASLALGESVGRSHQPTTWSLLATVGLALVFGLLVGAVTRAIASGPARGTSGVLGRVAVAVGVGVVVAELASLVMFSGSIDHRIDERAVASTEATPAVAQAAATLDRTRGARIALDTSVEHARGQLDNALVVARCEYHPTPACPQTRITGVPGTGPETRTANQLLADAQRELDNATATRDREAPGLDAVAVRDEQALNDARHTAIANAGRGLGARWVAMNDLTLGGAGGLLLRLLTIAFFALLYLLPLILRLWRGETTHDRHSTARAERERAELEAETAIAIKRAEVRREAEILWAEHQLTQARFAVEAQIEIDREHQRRRVVEALGAPEALEAPVAPIQAKAQRTFEPVEEDMYLPIAAEAEAASRAVAELPAGAPHARPESPEHLPAPAESDGAVEPHQEPAERAPLIPSIPDATRAAARWIRPLVPPFVARVIDNTTQPLRTARQVFEEVEEIAFSLKRTRKVTVNTESSDTANPAPLPPAPAPADADSPAPNRRVESSREYAEARTSGHAENYGRLATHDGYTALDGRASNDRVGLSLGSHERGGRRELVERDGLPELRSPEGPRQLPPAK